MERIGLVGVGYIGKRLAGQLLDAGHELAVYDVDDDQEAWARERGAAVAPDPAALAADVDVLALALPGAPEVRGVLADEGVLEALEPGSLLLDTSTTGPDTAEWAAAEAVDRDLEYLNAPLTGGGPGDGLHLLVGGDPATVETAGDLLAVLSEEYARVGTPRDAQEFKLSLQLLYAGREAVDAEVVALGRERGLPVELLDDLLALGVDERFFERDFSPGIEGLGGFAIWRKDLGYLLELAAEEDLAVPLASEVHAAYRHANQVMEPADGHAATILRHWERLGGDP